MDEVCIYISDAAALLDILTAMAITFAMGFVMQGRKIPFDMQLEGAEFIIYKTKGKTIIPIERAIA
jgi:hypothetical protein